MYNPIYALYLNYLSQKGSSSPKNIAYYQTMSKLTDLETELAPKLDEEGKLLLNDFYENFGKLESIVSKEAFTDGFQMGAQMILEVLGKDVC